jgi:hypothetical protein
MGPASKPALEQGTVIIDLTNMVEIKSETGGHARSQFAPHPLYYEALKPSK